MQSLSIAARDTHTDEHVEGFLLPPLRSSTPHQSILESFVFTKNEVSVTRSVVMQIVGSCKTEASRKSVPLHPVLARTLRTRRHHTKYKAAIVRVFAGKGLFGHADSWISTEQFNVHLTLRLNSYLAQRSPGCTFVPQYMRAFPALLREARAPGGVRLALKTSLQNLVCNRKGLSLMGTSDVSLRYSRSAETDSQCAGWSAVVAETLE